MQTWDHIETAALLDQEADWENYRQALLAQAVEEATNESLVLNALVYPEIGLDEMERCVWA